MAQAPSRSRRRAWRLAHGSIRSVLSRPKQRSSDRMIIAQALQPLTRTTHLPIPGTLTARIDNSAIEFERSKCSRQPLLCLSKHSKCL